MKQNSYRIILTLQNKKNKNFYQNVWKSNNQVWKNLSRTKQNVNTNNNNHSKNNSSLFEWIKKENSVKEIKDSKIKDSSKPIQPQ